LTTAAPPAAIQGCGERVLVVEDDRAVRAVAVRALRRLGYNVLEAENGEDALRLCARHPHAIDLLLTDMGMPRLSGRELVERLSPTPPELRVLYMSGYTDNASLHSDRLPGNARFLQKPFMPSDLAVKVRETLDAPTTAQTRTRGP
jgi:CheY-like chemotaxis protein